MLLYPFPISGAGRNDLFVCQHANTNDTQDHIKGSLAFGIRRLAHVSCAQLDFFRRGVRCTQGQFEKTMFSGLTFPRLEAR